MRVLLARERGFCTGIRRAVSSAELALNSGARVAAADTLLHNAREMERLRTLGSVPWKKLVVRRLLLQPSCFRRMARSRPNGKPWRRQGRFWSTLRARS